MCVDYTSLNKACPKDLFPLPYIDQVVDSTAGCEALCFLDAYSGYHQIAMCVADQLTTSFITPFGTYCYQTMPFGLKNAGATFQRCMRRVFGELIGCIIEAYVDDIIVKLERGTEDNPEKILAIMDMGTIKNLKGVQRVTGCLAALSRFIARIGERRLRCTN
jgi:hypothetical protein